MNDADGNLFNGRVRVGEAENIGAGYGLGVAAGAHDVTDAAADAGGRSAIGLDGGRTIVRFDLHANGPFVVQGDHACVVFKNAECPGAGEFAGGRKMVHLTRLSMI